MLGPVPAFPCGGAAFFVWRSPFFSGSFNAPPVLMQNGYAERGKWLRHGGKLGQGPALQIGGEAAVFASSPRPFYECPVEPFISHK